MNIRLKWSAAIGIVVTLASQLNAQIRKEHQYGKLNIAENIDTAVVAEPLDGRVNTPYIEYGPTPTKDGKRLYFSRQGYEGNSGGASDEDIWFSEFNDATQTWKEAINIGPPLNNAGPNFVCGVGTNGDTLLLGNVYGKNGKMKAGLSVSVRVGDSWSFPEPVHIENDYNLSERTSFDLSTDRKVLLIAQKKVDSKGGLDLYMAVRDDNHKNPYAGKESVNLGSVINSAGDETSPFLAYDNRTLYFSSNGHKGYGKYDVFVSRRLDDTWTNWSKPENLGSGINTAYDDTFFGFTPRSRYAYYSRGLTPANSDVYRLDMTYLFKPSSKPMNKMKDLIDQAQIGQSLVLDSVFNNNSAEIKASASDHLKYIVGYLKLFSNYIVLITTHSNKHESRDESQILSDQRALNVMNYLVAQGIRKDQLDYRGYGQDIVVNMDNLPTLKSMKSRVASSVEFHLVGFTSTKESYVR
jgi:outer membrane protein OmpA-like peptidoglycan-associated protein